jgi:hypothetical protein
MESQFIQRNSKKTIDVHKSIHAFAMAIGRQVQEEQAIKKDKVLRKTIRKVFQDNKDCLTLTKPTLVQMVLRYLDVTYSDYSTTLQRVELHITLNAGGYLSVMKGRGGGVSLKRKVQQ